MLEFIEANRLYLCVVIGILVGMPILWRRREILGLTKLWHAIPASFFMSFVSVVTTQIFGLFEQLIFPGSDRKFAIYGIFLMSTFVFIVLAKMLKKEWRDVLDVVAIYACPALFVMRIDCLFAHCCDGTIISGTDFYWPTTQAELVFFVGMLAFLLRREKTKPPKGTQYFLLVSVYAGFRFIIEWFRATPWNLLIHPAHLWSIIAFVFGVVMYADLMQKGIKKKSNRKERSARA